MKTPPRCIFCRCTTNNACSLPGGSTCRWLITNPRVCTSPACAFAAGLLEGLHHSGHPRRISLSWAQLVYEQARIRLGAPKS